MDSGVKKCAGSRGCPTDETRTRQAVRNTPATLLIVLARALVPTVIVGASRAWNRERRAAIAENAGIAPAPGRNAFRLPSIRHGTGPTAG